MSIPATGSVLLFVVGWTVGWLVLWRPRSLPPPPGRRSSSVSVIIPARNEAGSIGAVVAAVHADLAVSRGVGPDPGGGPGGGQGGGPGEGGAVVGEADQVIVVDEVIVVDDHSTDDTAAIAAAAGAVVVAAPALPTGWAGKAHACHVGAERAAGDVLVFVDADVIVASGTVGSLVAQVDRHRDGVVSVQPWHRTEGPGEQVSLLFNVVALMGCAGFTVGGAHVTTRVAFGPVLACHRSAYVGVGGHAHPEVRGAILEDIALARRFPRSYLFAGRSSGTSFRMYPNGFRQAIEGWTKGVGIGVDATPWWAVLGVIAWVSSLAGGWITSPWFAVASLAQLAVMAHWVGRFRWWAVVLYPVAIVVFVVIVLRSIWRRRTGRSVTWKGRDLVPDQETG
jgi:4,4'-diaponeurosporenoate glycosyltransferase